MAIIKPLIASSAGFKEVSAGDVFRVVNLPTMVGDSGLGGEAGAVPAPPAGAAQANVFLHASGIWKTATTNVSCLLEDGSTIVYLGTSAPSWSSIPVFDASDQQLMVALTSDNLVVTLANGSAGTVYSSNGEIPCLLADEVTSISLGLT